MVHAAEQFCWHVPRFGTDSATQAKSIDAWHTASLAFIAAFGAQTKYHAAALSLSCLPNPSSSRKLLHPFYRAHIRPLAKSGVHASAAALIMLAGRPMAAQFISSTSFIKWIFTHVCDTLESLWCWMVCFPGHWAADSYGDAG